jgi:hypothetical protein
VSDAADLARTLVDYDEELARAVLDAVREQLGGRLDTVPKDSDSVTTSEWKEGLARYERLRSLGLELQQLLR